MFFDSIGDISQIAAKNGTSVFVVPKSAEVQIKNAIIIEPEDKTVISIEQIHALLERLNLKQTKAQFVMIRPAEKISHAAANALLKTLEEPIRNIHFVLITDSPTQLLPTILSRAAIYILREEWSERGEIVASKKQKELAKKLISARGVELVTLAGQISGVKKDKKIFALEVVGAAIEILYKSYFITNREIFLKKIPKFLDLYENLSRNGNIKLHIVADLC